MNKGTNNWRLNHQIRAEKVRVLATDGNQAGVMSLTEALKQAENEGKDLIEIAPNANPPVVKIIEFGKFRYQEEKKQKKGRVKATDVKEVRFSPFIGDADYKTRIARVSEFLAAKHKVRVVVKFLGRQMGSRAFGYKLTGRILDEFTNQVNLDMEPKFLGRHLTMVISPLSTLKIKEKEDGKKEQQAEN